MLKNLFTRIAMLSGALALVSAHAMADDKVVGGGICYQTGGSGTLTYDAQGSVYNSSTTGEVDIDCPVVRDNPGATIAASNISFDVFDRSATRDVTCYFINEMGNTTGWAAAEVDSATSTGINQVGIKNMAVLTSSTALGATQFSHVRCSLPRKDSALANPSHLARIWMNEP